MPEPMSPEEYAASPEAVCPWCRSRNFEVVEGSEFEEDGRVEPDSNVRHAIEGLHCGDCGKHWFDTYRLTGYTES